MRDIFRMEKEIAMANFITPKTAFMMGSGRMIGWTDMENFITTLDRWNMRASGD
jgi:hypothetical protein